MKSAARLYATLAGAKGSKIAFAPLTPGARRIVSLLLWAFAFATVAYVARYLAHHRFETRYLIPVFCALAIVLELVVRPALGIRRDFLALVLNCAAASAAILVMKLLIEGSLLR